MKSSFRTHTLIITIVIKSLEWVCIFVYMLSSQFLLKASLMLYPKVKQNTRTVNILTHMPSSLHLNVKFVKINILANFVCLFSLLFIWHWSIAGNYFSLFAKRLTALQAMHAQPPVAKQSNRKTMPFHMLYLRNVRATDNTQTRKHTRTLAHIQFTK